MEKKSDINTVKTSFELAIAQKRAVADENCFYFLKKGTVNLFFRNKSATGQTPRMRFINEYTAPCLIAIPASDARRDLVLAAVSTSEISVVDADTLEQSAKDTPDEICRLVDNLLVSGLTASNKAEVSFLPVEFIENQQNVSNTAGQLQVANIREAMWITANEKSLKLFNIYDLPSCQVYPLTNKIWYCIEKSVTFEVLTTSELRRRNKTFFKDLLLFWNVIYFIDSDAVKNTTTDSVRQIYANVESNKGNRQYSQEKLLELINPIRTDDNLFVESDSLLGCLHLIGEHEKIKFKKTATVRNHYTPLDNILMDSGVRARKVKLNQEWYKNNNDAFLTYTVDEKEPVALIPKGNSAYKAINYAKKSVEVVTKENADKFDSEVYSFFPSFPNTKMTGKSLLSFGLDFVKKDLIYFVVIGSIGAILALFIPIIMGYIFDNVIPNSSTNELLQILILLLTVAISMGLLDFAQSVSLLRLEGILNHKLQAAVWDRLLSLKVRFFHKYASGDLAERAMGINKIREVISGSVLNAVISFIFSLFYFALLFYYNVKLALVALALGLIIITFTVLMSYYGFKHIKVIRYLEVILSGFLFQIINGISKIRITNSNERAFSQWVGRYSIQKKHYLAKRSVNIAGEVFTAFFPILSALFIFLRVHKLLVTGDSDFTVGDYISFNNAFLCFQGALLQMSMATVPLLTIKPVFDMFRPIIEAESEYAGEKNDPGELNGEIGVSKLSFRYDEHQEMIINDVSFKIHKGEYVALVGGSGSGKSTLLRLLLGFEEPALGQVIYNNKDLSKLDIRKVRSQMGVVLQNGKLMAGTVLYNIIGSSDLTEEDAWKAARQAGCDREIEALKDKMYTEIAPGDPALSGGQVQRIIIARAFAKKPKILFFDEATSALDNTTQKIVTKSIEQMDATRVVIAHRLSTIMNAHRIIVLDKGQLIESGTYDELLNKGGYFADLARRQFV